MEGWRRERGNRNRETGRIMRRDEKEDTKEREKKTRKMKGRANKTRNKKRKGAVGDFFFF